MAKRATTTTGEKKFSFNDLAKKMEKINPEGLIASINSERIKINNWINTGNYLLNAQISGTIFGGIPEGRITMFSGLAGTGKTYLSLNVCKSAQDQGYKIIWVDTENAIDDKTFERFGIDPSNVLYVPMNVISELSTYLVNVLDSLIEAKAANQEIDKYIVVIDSLGNLSTDKEVRDVASGSDKADMTRAKELKRLFRVLTKKLGQLKIAAVITNHVYANIGSFYPSNTPSGGTGAIFNASTIIELSKAQLKEDGDGKPKTGIVVTSNIPKSRFTRALPIKFHISFIHGMNPYVGLENYVDWDSCGVDYGKIENGEFKKGATKTRVCAKHLTKSLPAKQLWTPTVFTQEVLELIDKKISSIYALPPVNQRVYELDEFLPEGEDDEEIEDIFDDNE